MFSELLSPEELEIQNLARKFAKEKVSKELLMAMDNEEVQYPHEFVKALADEGLLGIRFEPKYGGKGLGWTAEVGALEEIGVLGMALSCHFAMPSIVGEAMHMFGTDEQKEKWLAPLLKGEIRSAEALTEPHSGSDFFSAMTRAKKDGDHFVLNGQKRFVVGA